MFSLFAVIVLNVAPIQQIHLDTEQGKEQFAQKVQACATELQQKWDRVKELQQALNASLVKLSTMVHDSDEWQRTTDEAEMLAIEWQAASQDIPELKATVDAGLKGIQESACIVNLVRAAADGEELAQDDQELLKYIAAICQRE